VEAAARVLSGLALALAVLASSTAGADSVDLEDTAEIGGVAFARELAVHDTPLTLHSLGLLQRFFIKGYAAALYLGEGASPADVLADVPRRLELQYYLSIDGDDFARAALAILERNLPSEELERLRGRIDDMAALFEDVSAGDRYALTYLPGRGTELALNGELRGTIPGADFAAAYFGIWLGDDPIDAGLRDRLLEGR
jgi:hypothetical protein